MDVPRIPPLSSLDPGTPASGERQQGGGGGLPFEAGQRLFARVLQTLGDGRAVLDVAGERLLASTPVPVHDGDVLAVVVRGLNPVVELDIEAPPLAFSERAYALAAVRQALQQVRPAAPLTTAEIEVLAQALERANWGSGAPGVSPRDRLLALVRPIPMSADAAALIEPLRQRLALGGLAFEAHAAKALAGEGRTPPPDLPAVLQADLRWLLAALAREAALPPEVEALRLRLVDDISGRQLEVAQARLRDGEVRVDVPLLFGQQDAPARLVIADAPARDAHAGGGPAGRTIALTVSHPDLGPVDASARWLDAAPGGELQVRFAVRDETSAASLSRAADALGARLRAIGFRHVSVAVAVDPEAGAPPPDRGPDEPPPGGSIVSALA
jgi:hypothetical protein